MQSGTKITYTKLLKRKPLQIKELASTRFVDFGGTVKPLDASRPHSDLPTSATSGQSKGCDAHPNFNNHLKPRTEAQPTT